MVQSLEISAGRYTTRQKCSHPCFWFCMGSRGNYQIVPKTSVRWRFQIRTTWCIFFWHQVVDDACFFFVWTTPFGTRHPNPSEVAYQLCVEETHHVSGIGRRGCVCFRHYYNCWVIPLPSNSHHQDDTTCLHSFATIHGMGDNPNNMNEVLFGILLLLAEIPNNHLGCINPVYGIFEYLPYQLVIVIAGFLNYQQYRLSNEKTLVVYGIWAI